MAAAPEHDLPVVVGFDGSPGAVAAARWAAAEAALRRVDLHVVHLWQYPGLAFPHDDPRPPSPHTLPAPLEDLLTPVLGDHPGLRVRRATIEADPGHGLVQAAAAADLLVVGRTRHHLEVLALGSVSRHCALHATCPVVTVPPPPDAPRRVTG